MTAPSARRVATLVVVPPALLRSHHSPPPHALPKVDPESMTFLAAADSPTGYAGVMFAGAWSGTLSLYEFKKAPRAIPPRLATCPLTLTLPTCTPTSGGRQQVQHLPRGVHPRPQLPGDPGPARTSLRLDRDLPGGLRRCVRRNVPQGALVKSALCSTRSPTRRVITLRGTQRTWLSWMSSLPAQPLYLAIFVAPMGRVWQTLLSGADSHRDRVPGNLGNHWWRRVDCAPPTTAKSPKPARC